MRIPGYLDMVCQAMQGPGYLDMVCKGVCKV